MAGVDQRILEIVIRARDETAKGIGSATKNADKLSAGKIAGGIAAGAVGAVTAIAVAYNHAADTAAGYAGQVINVQRLTGLNAKASSDAAGLMDRYGVSGKQLGMVFKTLDQQIMVTTDGTSKQKTALERMNIASKDSTGKNRDAMAVLGDVANYYQNATDKTQAAALASKVLGRGYMSLLPVLANGKAGIDSVTEGLKKNGLELSQGQIDAAKTYGKSVKDNEEAMKGLEVQVGLTALPIKTELYNALAKVFQWLNTNRPMFEAFFNNLKTQAQPYVTILAKAVGMLVDAWKELAPKLVPLMPLLKAVALVLGGALYLAILGIIGVLTLVVKGVSAVIDAFKWLGDAVQGPIQKVRDAMSYLNPFARHSPSLIDNVQAGVAAIKGHYASLGGMSIGAPSLGGLAFAGGGSYGFGSSYSPTGGRDIVLQIDGREVARVLGSHVRNTTRAGTK